MENAKEPHIRRNAMFNAVLGMGEITKVASDVLPGNSAKLSVFQMDAWILQWV
jgi:hypothetical protein